MTKQLYALLALMASLNLSTAQLTIKLHASIDLDAPTLTHRVDPSLFDIEPTPSWALGSLVQNDFGKISIGTGLVANSVGIKVLQSEWQVLPIGIHKYITFEVPLSLSWELTDVLFLDVGVFLGHRSKMRNTTFLGDEWLNQGRRVVFGYFGGFGASLGNRFAATFHITSERANRFEIYTERFDGALIIQHYGRMSSLRLGLNYLINKTSANNS